ncbi:hypothetical protein [Embleya sp. NBC_00896]|uniref:hypothetical protein n=1 Tax=Embleya sp. NBC_00896 TaxID=2975961 RepID=UPI002F91785B|nr:type II toxin-antitoxin system HicB family antitoxin [Embleya sp. NBC_00896]
MDLTPYVDKICRDLADAAEAGGEDARALAERLIPPLESATRLALLGALSAAADEITRDLAPGSVDVRLRGLDPDFVVTPPPPVQSFEDAAGQGAAADGFAAPPPTAGAKPQPEPDEGGTSRITLRLSEGVKSRVEAAAGRDGLSVNAWLVRAVSAALEPDDRARRAERPGSAHESGRRYTGWVR